MKKHLTLLLLIPFCIPATNRCVSEHLKWIAGVAGVGAVGCMVYKWWTKKPKQLHPQPNYESSALINETSAQGPRTDSTTPNESVEPSAASSIDLVDPWENPAQGLTPGFKAGLRSFLETIPSLEVRTDNSHRYDAELNEKLGSAKYNIESYLYEAERLGFSIKVCLKDLRDALSIVHDALQAINGQGYNFAGNYQTLINTFGEEAQDLILKTQMDYAQGIINHLKKKLA